MLAAVQKKERKPPPKTHTSTQSNSYFLENIFFFLRLRLRLRLPLCNECALRLGVLAGAICIKLSCCFEKDENFKAPVK